MLLFQLLSSNHIVKQLSLSDTILSAVTNNNPPPFSKEEVMLMKNPDYVRNYIGYYFKCTYPNLVVEQIKNFIDGLFYYTQDLNGMVRHIRHFLFSLKQFAGDANWLYLDDLEEQKEMINEEKKRIDSIVPGLKLEDDDLYI
jgi:hypothetical protein